ncbi:transcriptional regulator [Streptococcus gallolyticus]|uniref:Transcriptional regulator n=1 Tax=Streptococcus gallolyticus TaxID=315405 RepID=A0A368UFG5_9STRE|nr:helix-turn-helix transcriptional regulator [Streptococcus gallolyticus]RCW17262.1 transcriptional regulator [Streptococcus gallolyticus]
MYRRIRDSREDHDYTQEYLANFLSCSQSAYSKFEAGRRQIPIDFLIKLSTLYDVSTDYLLDLTEDPNRIKYRNSPS